MRERPISYARYRPSVQNPNKSWARPLFGPGLLEKGRNVSHRSCDRTDRSEVAIVHEPGGPASLESSDPRIRVRDRGPGQREGVTGMGRFWSNVAGARCLTSLAATNFGGQQFPRAWSAGPVARRSDGIRPGRSHHCFFRCALRAAPHPRQGDRQVFAVNALTSDRWKRFC